MSDAPLTDALAESLMPITEGITADNARDRIATLLHSVFTHAVKLERENAKLRAWIRAEGQHDNACTYDVLCEVCRGCRCERRPKAEAL